MSVILGLLIANATAWLWAFLTFGDHPAMLGTAALAYGFGLRHAFDADHIAAIDNVTRKLMNDRQKPLTVGLWFSLGHSTVVALASAGVAVTAFAFQDKVDFFHGVGGVIGAAVSSLFLLLIAGANVAVLCATCWRLVRLRRGDPGYKDQANMLLAGGGILARIWRPMFRLISRSWHMYPLGFLFGLGFDTATEVAMLGISATSASRGLPIATIMVFPALFTAGMTLMDTIDSMLMVGAYGWAFAKPARKLYYNIFITALSILVALLVGGVEALGLIGDQTGVTGDFWSAVRVVNDNLGLIGFGVVAVFLLSWAAVVALQRWGDAP